MMTKSPATNRKPAQEYTPDEVLHRANNKITSLEGNLKHVDYKALALADLREGKPVYVTHGFKWEGEIVPGGTLWHPGMEYLPRIAELMEASIGGGRMFMTKEAADAGTYLKQLKTLVQDLMPLVAESHKYSGQAASARAAEAQARRAAEEYKAQAEQAEKNSKVADKALAEFHSKIKIEI